MNMKTNLAHEPPILQHVAEVVQFPKGKKVVDKFEKGYIMSSRLYHDEVRPFLSPAAKDIYEELNARISGFNKESDFVSYSQLQGGKLEGSHKLSPATVRKGLKELIDFGVITVVSENIKKGNEYRINEVSLVEHFKNKSTTSKSEVLNKDKHFNNKSTSKSEVLQKVKCYHFKNDSASTSKSEDTIDILYRYIYIDIIKSLRSQKPLEKNYLVFQELKKQQQLEQEKLEAAKKLKAEAERKEKSRKLSFDEVMKLTSEKFQSLCDLDLWEQYVSARSQLSKTKLTKNALNTIYKDFTAWGFAGATQSLKTSITGNYQGLFEPKITDSSYQYGNSHSNDFQFGDLAYEAMQQGGYRDV